MQDAELVQKAVEAAKAAYAPYSNYHVGAALLTSGGHVFTGANVENASYGLTVCAERTAVAHAVTSGQRTFEAIAVVTRDGGTPCGSCRQVLAEFARDMKILVGRPDGTFRLTSLAALLPDAFDLER